MLFEMMCAWFVICLRTTCETFDYFDRINEWVMKNNNKKKNNWKVGHNQKWIYNTRKLFKTILTTVATWFRWRITVIFAEIQLAQVLKMNWSVCTCDVNACPYKFQRAAKLESGMNWRLKQTHTHTKQNCWSVLNSNSKAEKFDWKNRIEMPMK